MSSESENDMKEAHDLLHEWGTERARIQSGGYPSGTEPNVPGNGYADRTFATVSRLNHLLAVDNAVGCLAADHRRALELQYVLGSSVREAAKRQGMASTTWARMRKEACHEFLRQYRLGLWRIGRLDKRPVMPWDSA